MSGTALTWTDIARRTPLWLNLGGKGHGDGHPEYAGYVSVDIEPGQHLHVVHDLRQPIPLPDGSVDRMHTEDFLHYLSREDMASMLRECYRLLRPGGLLRISLPDYAHPKDRIFLAQGSDPRHPRHLVLTDRRVLEDMLRQSPFTSWTFHHFWQDGMFVERPFDAALGTIQRTPEHDPRNKCAVNWRWRLRNAATRLRYGLRVPEGSKPLLRGHRLHVTSLIVDCFKN